MEQKPHAADQAKIIVRTIEQLENAVNSTALDGGQKDRIEKIIKRL